MTEQEIERGLERFVTCKVTDVMNFDYAGTLAYIQRLKAENAELKSSLTHANEEYLKWHERAQNLLKDSGGSISGYEKKISDLQAGNAELRARLENAVELPVKVGDTVYFIPTYNGKPIWGVQRGIVQMVGITRQGYHVKIRDRADFNKTYMFRKSAFLSKEQAEARLAKLKEKKEKDND